MVTETASNQPTMLGNGNKNGNIEAVIGNSCCTNSQGVLHGSHPTARQKHPYPLPISR